MIERYTASDLYYPMDINVCEYGVKTGSDGINQTAYDYNMIFYMAEGSGNFYINNECFLLTKGKTIVVFSRESFKMEAMSSNCDYYWIGFNGFKANTYLSLAGSMHKRRIFQFDKPDALLNYFIQLIDSQIWGKSRRIWLSSIAHMVLAIMIESKSIGNEEKSFTNKELYVRETVNFLEQHYCENINIHQLSEHVKVHRRHLWLVFKEVTGMSPQEYLIKLRVEKACELMRNSNLSIKTISNMVGYTNEKLFFKIFKQVKGMAPGQFRAFYIAPPAGRLLTGWSDIGIGNLRIKGSSEYNNDMFTLYSSGWDIWHNNDEFQFVYKEITGECTIIARVLSIRNTDRWAKAGIMIRTDLNTHAPAVCLLATPGMGMNFQYRLQNMGFHETINKREIAVPVLFKLVITNNMVYAYYSRPGDASWMQISQPVRLDFSSRIFVGLAATSHDTRSLTCAVFDNVQISS